MGEKSRREMPLARVGLFVLAYGTLVAAVLAARAADWISAGMAGGGIALVVLYAVAMLLMGGWWPLVAALIPVLWASDFALFYESEANECYPGCNAYQDILGALLYVLTLLFAVAIGLALVQGIRRRRAVSQ